MSEKQERWEVKVVVTVDAISGSDALDKVEKIVGEDAPVLDWRVASGNWRFEGR